MLYVINFNGANPRQPSSFGCFLLLVPLCISWCTPREISFCICHWSQGKSWRHDINTSEIPRSKSVTWIFTSNSNAHPCYFETKRPDDHAILLCFLTLSHASSDCMTLFSRSVHTAWRFSHVPFRLHLLMRNSLFSHEKWFQRCVHTAVSHEKSTWFSVSVNGPVSFVIIYHYLGLPGSVIIGVRARASNRNGLRRHFEVLWWWHRSGPTIEDHPQGGEQERGYSPISLWHFGLCQRRHGQTSICH